MIIITLMKSKIFKWNGILTENNAKKVGGQKLLFHRDQQEFAFFQLKTSGDQSEISPPKLLL